MKKKAIALLSGGLDSTLAIKLLLEQGVEVVALTFTSPFCTCTSRAKREAGCRHEALRVSQKLGVEVRLVAKGKEYLEVVRNPKHGRGRGINPCIDCRIFMFKKAAGFFEELGGGFLVTGEVLGQRPMSQNRQAIEQIEREAGLEGKILRPLSAMLFEPTEAERLGWVDREKLLAMSGRSRKPQFELAESFGIQDYACPAGGCLLTDPNFGERLQDLFDHTPGELDPLELELLKIGRHFRLPNGTKIVVGRNQEQNQRLEKLAVKGAVRLAPVDFIGPTVLVLGGGDEILPTAAALLVHYASKAPLEPRVKVCSGTEPLEIVPDPGFSFEAVKGYALGTR